MKITYLVFSLVLLLPQLSEAKSAYEDCIKAGNNHKACEEFLASAEPPQQEARVRNCKWPEDYTLPGGKCADQMARDDRNAEIIPAAYKDNEE